MADNGQSSKQSKKSNRQNSRLGSGIGQNSSRVSKVVGGMGSQSVRVEQRSNSSTVKQSSRGQTSAKRTHSGKSRAKKAHRRALTSLLIHLLLLMGQQTHTLSIKRVMHGVAWSHTISSVFSAFSCW